MKHAEQFLLFLSKTDQELLSHCPPATRSNQTALGIFVLFTGLLATASGAFAVSNLFLEPVPGQALPQLPLIGLLFSILIGLFYGAIILFIDREIVSASSKWGVVLRVPLAILIGLVIAVPLELKLLEGRISQQIIEKEQGYNQSLQAVGEQKLAVIRSEIQSEKTKLDHYIAQKQQYADLMMRESGGLAGSLTGQRGEGPVYREALRNKEVLEEDIQTQEAYLTTLQDQLDQLAQQNSTFTDRYTRVESHDFLSKYIALRELRQQPNEAGYSTNQLAWGITLLLVFLELIPSLMKLLLPMSEYDVLKEARRHLNVQQAHKAAHAFSETLSDSEDPFPDQGSGDAAFISKLKDSMMR